MLGFIKRLFERQDALAQDIAAILDAERQKWRSISTEELAALTDGELVAAARTRIDVLCDEVGDSTAAATRLNGEQRVLRAVAFYEAEMWQGGLCQYFVNDGGLFAPMLSDALAAVGADAHRAQFDAFVREHSIDLHTLEPFSVGGYPSMSECREAMGKRYPLDDFDAAFYELPSPMAGMASYIRAHITAF